MRKRWIWAVLGSLGLIVTAILIITLLVTSRSYMPREGDIVRVLCPRISTGQVPLYNDIQYFRPPPLTLEVGSLRCGSKVRIVQVIKIPFDDPSVTAYFIVPLEGFEPSQPISVWIPEEGNIGLGGWLEIPKGYKLIKFELVSGK